jgi:hypothetical protein
MWSGSTPHDASWPLVSGHWTDPSPHNASWPPVSGQWTDPSPHNASWPLVSGRWTDPCPHNASWPLVSGQWTSSCPDHMCKQTSRRRESLTYVKSSRRVGVTSSDNSIFRVCVWKLWPCLCGFLIHILYLQSAAAVMCGCMKNTDYSTGDPH